MYDQKEVIKQINEENRQASLIEYNEEKERCMIERKNYESFLKLIGNFSIFKEKRHYKLRNEPYMDLVIEFLGTPKIGEFDIAISHYGEQNGDLMADPDMEIKVDRIHETIVGMSYRNDYIGVLQESFEEGGIWSQDYNDIQRFLQTRLKNISEQGFNMGQNISLKE